MQIVDGIGNAIGIGIQIRLAVNAVGCQAAKLVCAVCANSIVVAVVTFLGELIGMTIRDQHNVLSVVGNCRILGKHLVGFNQARLDIGTVQTLNRCIIDSFIQLIRVLYFAKLTSNDCCSAKDNHTDFQLGIGQLLLCEKLRN